MNFARLHSTRDTRTRRNVAGSRRRALIAIPLLGGLVLALLWTVISARLSVERDTTYREATASAAILSSALEQHTVKAIHQVDQITRFVKYEFEKSPEHFDLGSTVEKGVVQSDTLVQVSIIDDHGILVASTAEANPTPIDLSDREHFKVHEHENDDQLYISKPVLGRVSHQWTLQMTRRLNHLDGSFAGVVVVSEDPGYFTSDFYNNAAIGKEGVIAVIADNGAVLARRTGTGRNTPGAFSASGSYPISEHVSGTMVDPIDHIKRIVSYRHIDGYPMGVLVGLSEAEEFADYNHTRNVYLLMAGFISLAMLAFFAVATGLIGKLLGREREMTHLVEYDLLTGLRNRYATLQSLRHDVADPSNVGRLALLFIDLDNFKTVNDTLGHNAGDIVLQMTASRLSDAVGGAGVLSRIGGDEFVVVLKGGDVERQAVQLAESVRETFEHPFDVRGTSFVLHASIGIALYSVGSESEIDLLKKADLAMYSAKDAGKNCYQFYAPPVSSRRSFDAMGTAAARRTGRESTVPRLSAENRSGAPLHHGLRSPRAVESSATRRHFRERVHPRRRIDGSHRADRRLRDSNRLPATGRMAARGLRDALARGQHIGCPVLARRSLRNDLARNRGNGHSRSSARVGDHRNGDDGIPGTRLGEDRRIEAARREHRARRFRHGLFLAVVPEPLFGRHAQGGPLVRTGDPGRSQRLRDGVGDRQPRALARLDRGRRGH